MIISPKSVFCIQASKGISIGKESMENFASTKFPFLCNPKRKTTVFHNEQTFSGKDMPENIIVHFQKVGFL